MRLYYLKKHKWCRSIQGSDMAVFYYAGHGIQVKGKNYLLPVDFPDNVTTPAFEKSSLRIL